MNTIVETERIYIRHFGISDAGFLRNLLNSPGWLEYIGDRNVHTEDDARDYLINGPIKSYETNGFGLSLVVRKEGDISIGACGLLKRDFLDNPDIGFAFLPEFMHLGYAFESAAAMMNYAKDGLKIAKVYAFTVPQNTASIKLLEKIGFHFEKVFAMPDHDEELFLYKNNSLYSKD